MAIEKERRFIQNLRTTGITAPDTSVIDVHDGEIAVGMNSRFPKLFVKKEDGNFEEFVGLGELLNSELATMKAITQLKEELIDIREIIGNGIPGKSITEYLHNKFDDFVVL